VLAFPLMGDAADTSSTAGRRVAVVTGGAGAIGGAITAALAAAGHTVVSLDQAADPPVDLASDEQVRAAAADVLGRQGRCDVLVHAAAFDKAGLADLDLTAWRRVQAVNVEAALLLAQAFVPRMAERGFGRIVFIVSHTVWSPPAIGKECRGRDHGSRPGGDRDRRGRRPWPRDHRWAAWGGPMTRRARFLAVLRALLVQHWRGIRPLWRAGGLLRQHEISYPERTGVSLCPPFPAGS